MSTAALASRRPLQAGATPRWLGLLPDALQALLFLCSACTLVLAIASVVMTAYGQPPRGGLQLAAYLLAMPILCLAPGAAAQAARQQIAVWQRRQVPGHGALFSIHAWHRLMVTVLALMVLPMLLIAALHWTYRQPPFGGPGLFETPLLALHFAGLALLASAGWRGLLPAACTLAGPLLLTEWTLRLTGWWPASDTAARLWLAGALSMTLPLGWRLCTVHLHRGRQARADQRRIVPAASPGHLWRGLRKDIQLRWRPLDGKTSFFGAVLITTILMPMGDVGMLATNVTGRYEATVWIVPRMAWLCLLATTLLRAPDLHWRLLLAPKTLGRRHLGWRILADSLAGMLLLWTLVSLFNTAALHGITGQAPVAGWWPAVVRNGMAQLPELVFVTCLTVALRGAGLTGRHRQRWLTGGLAAVVGLAVLLACLTVVFRWESLERLARLPLWQRDEAQAVVLLLLSFGLAGLAARLWSRADLNALLAERASAQSRAG